MQQKGLHRLRLMGKHLFDQVINDVAMAAAKVGQEKMWIGASLQGERRQLQSGDPALRAALEGSHSLGRYIELHRGLEKGAGFLGTELQMRSTHLAELASRAQAGKRQGRINARRDDQVQVGQGMLQESSHGALQRFSCDEVVIIKHEHHIPSGLLVEITDQQIHDRLGRRGRRGRGRV